MQYFRIAPTPWVRTIQPASVSMGEPQLPIFTASHMAEGRRITSGLLQWCGPSENMMDRFSLSWRDSMA